MTNRKQKPADITRLAPELLAGIFIICRDEDMLNSNHPYAWIKVAHVCQYFREVALACAKLWSHIPVTSRNYRWLERTKEMILRSNQAPLALKSYDNENEELLRLIKDEMYRMQTLSLRIPSHSLLGATPAPNLRRLNLRIHTQSTELCWSEIFGEIGTPNLEEMHVISHAGLSWAKKTAFPKTLRVLDIVQQNRTPRLLSDVIGVLERLPHLETLSLEGLLPIFAPHSRSLPVVEHPTILRRLTRLTIVGSVSRCAVFLSNIVTPELVDLRIKCVLTSQFALGLLAPVVRDRLSDSPLSSSSQRLLSLALDESSGLSETNLFAWSSLDHVNGMPAPDSQLSRTFGIAITHDHWWDTVPSFIAQLPIANVQLLNVCVGTHVSSQFAYEKLEAWQTAFQPITALREVHVVGRRQPLPFRKANEDNDHMHFSAYTQWDEAVRRGIPHDDPHWGGLFDEEEDLFWLNPDREAVREKMRQRRFSRRPRRRYLSYRGKSTEQDAMWKKMREVLPSVQICTFNDLASSADNIDAVQGPQLRYPLIPKWGPGDHSTWPFVQDI